jgi:2-polyprenyl-6-methoxyphenol hydroxylase-like FAD-dependent oxidoreductase
MEVLVVGAGPTGLALALALAAHGVRPRIIDRAQDRTHESRALAIQPRTLEVLAGLGVSNDLIAAGNPGVRVVLHGRRREFSTGLFDLGLSDTAYPYILFLSQAETERILLGHLDRFGVTVERGVSLVGLNAGADEVVAVLRHDDGREETVATPYVVGCDGARSAVRTMAGIGFEGGSYPQHFVLADLEVDGLAPGAAHAFLAERGLVLFFPLVHPASWRLIAMRPRGVPDEPVTLEALGTLVREYGGARLTLRDPVWMTDFRLHHRAATRYRAGRAFLAGDAAHIHSPVGAQGMNTGIQDSVNLGWKLAAALRGHASPSILDTYDPERAPVGRVVVNFTDRAFRVATSSGFLVRLVRARVVPRLLPLGARLGSVRSYLFRIVSQLGIRYRRSALSIEGAGAPRRGPRAGDRIPDGALVDHGVATTLHAALAPPGWHLLRSTGGRTMTVRCLADPDHPDVVFDVDPNLAARLGIRPGHGVQLLVRPDGHVGFRSGPDDHDGLSAYLKRWSLLAS